MAPPIPLDRLRVSLVWALAPGESVRSWDTSHLEVSCGQMQGGSLASDGRATTGAFLVRPVWPAWLTTPVIEGELRFAFAWGYATGLRQLDPLADTVDQSVRVPVTWPTGGALRVGIELDFDEPVGGLTGRLYVDDEERAAIALLGDAGIERVGAGLVTGWPLTQRDLLRRVTVRAYPPAIQNGFTFRRKGSLVQCRVEPWESDADTGNGAGMWWAVPSGDPVAGDAWPANIVGLQPRPLAPLGAAESGGETIRVRPPTCGRVLRASSGHEVLPGPAALTAGSTGLAWNQTGTTLYGRGSPAETWLPLVVATNRRSACAPRASNPTLVYTADVGHLIGLGAQAYWKPGTGAYPIRLTDGQPAGGIVVGDVLQALLWRAEPVSEAWPGGQPALSDVYHEPPDERRDLRAAGAWLYVRAIDGVGREDVVFQDHLNRLWPVAWLPRDAGYTQSRPVLHRAGAPPGSGVGAWWWAHYATNAQIRRYLSVTGGQSWMLHESTDLEPGVKGLMALAHALLPSGRQVLAGTDPDEGTVCFFWTPGWADSWRPLELQRAAEGGPDPDPGEGAVDRVAVSRPVAPYVYARPEGVVEVGWLADGTWQRYVGPVGWS